MEYLLSENIGKPLEYVTEKELRSSVLVQAQVTSDIIYAVRAYAGAGAEFLNSVIKETDDMQKKGMSQSKADYEWIGISSVISGEQPCCWVLSYEDYYTSEQYDSRDVECGAEDGFNYKKASFSLTYEGKTYDECCMVLLIPHPDSTDAGSGAGGFGISVNVFYRVPAGYDGCMVGFHNSAALTQEQIEMGLSDPAASLGPIMKMTGDLYMRLKQHV